MQNTRRQRRRVSEALYKSKHIHPTEATTSQANEMSDFTSNFSLEFGEDVKKRLSLLSEVVLRTVKRRLTSSFAIFFAPPQ